LDALSERAPVIVVVTQCAALVVYWVNAPSWLPYGLAVIVGSLALVLMAARGRRPQFASNEDLGLNSSKDWIAQELAGKGTPQGFYLLGFFGFVTIMLTGFQGAYATPAWAAFALGAAWGIANARYTTGDGSES
jgi:H+/Cl- antiporter ClcA